MDILNSECVFHDVLVFEENGLLYEDDQGEVKLSYIGDNSFITDVNIPMQFKSHISLVLTDDIIGIVVPEVEINEKQEEYIKGFLFNVYDLEGNLLFRKPALHKYNVLEFYEGLNNKYFHTQANQVGEYIIVIANNFSDKAAVAWLLRKNDHGMFDSIAGNHSITERTLFKLHDKNSEFVLNGNMLVYSQAERNNVGNYTVEKTYLYKFDITELAKDISRGGGINEYLLSDNEKKFIFSTENKISFLRNVKDMQKIAFIEHADSDKILHLRNLDNGDDFTYSIKDKINNLYITTNDENFVIISIFNEKGITIIILDDLHNVTKVITTPKSKINNVKKLLNTIHGYLEENDNYKKSEDVNDSIEHKQSHDSKEIGDFKWYAKSEGIKDSKNNDCIETIQFNDIRQLRELFEHQSLKESQNFDDLEKPFFPVIQEKVVSKHQQLMDRLAISFNKSIIDEFSFSETLGEVDILLGLIVYNYIKRYRRKNLL